MLETLLFYAVTTVKTVSGDILEIIPIQKCGNLHICLLSVIVLLRHNYNYHSSTRLPLSRCLKFIENWKAKTQLCIFHGNKTQTIVLPAVVLQK